MTEPPQAQYVAPHETVVPLMLQIEDNLGLALEQRAELPEARTYKITRWPSRLTNFHDYQLYARYKERLRTPPPDVLDNGGTVRGYRGSQERSRCHPVYTTALCAVYVAGLSAVTMEGLSGIHLTLDILDGVRTRLDRGFVVEDGPLRSLVRAQVLTPEQIRVIRSLAVGVTEDGMAGLDQFTCKSMLFSLANRVAVKEYLEGPGRAAGRQAAEAQLMMRAWPVIGLEIEAEAVTRDAAQALRNELRRRRDLASENQKRYANSGRPAPASGVYI